MRRICLYASCNSCMEFDIFLSGCTRHPKSVNTSFKKHVSQLPFAACTFNLKEARLDFGCGAKWFKFNRLESMLLIPDLVGAPVSQTAPRSIRNGCIPSLKLPLCCAGLKKKKEGGEIIAAGNKTKTKKK